MLRIGTPLLAGLCALLLCSSGRGQATPPPAVPPASPPATPPATPPASSPATPPAKPTAPPKPLPGDARVRPALENGLVWLCRHQDPDGGWHAKTVGTRCDTGANCAAVGEGSGDDAHEMSDMYDPGLTSLAVLALLGSGTTSAAPIVVHGAKADVSFDTWDAAKRGIAWLMSKQAKDGSFAGPGLMYNECLGVLALSEAYRLNKNWDCRESARKAVEFLEAGQTSNPSGKGRWGWRYVPKMAPADTSVTGWAVRAFESADRVGIKVPKPVLAGAQDFIVWITGEKGGLVGYLDPQGAGQKVTGFGDKFDYHVGTMSALGIQVHLRTDPKPDKATQEWIKTAVNEVLLHDIPSAKAPLGVDYYYWHQAMEAWSVLGAHGLKPLAQSGLVWRQALVEALLSLQTAPSEKCSSGGWLAADRWAHAGGPVYTTAINVMTLEGAAGS